MAAPLPAPPRSASGRARRARLALALALIVAVLAVLAACSAIDVLGDLEGELEDEGFTDVSANVSPTDASLVVVSADAPAGDSTEEAQDQAAEVVWTRFPRRFDALRVTVDGEREQRSYTQLREDLGPRPDGLDTSTEIGDEWTRMSVIVVLALLVAGVLGVGLIGLVVFLVVRSNRRRTASGGERPRPRPQPWMPPGVPGAGPVAPPGGWTPASAPPAPPPPPATAPPSLAKPPPEVQPTPVPGPPGPWTTPPTGAPEGTPGAWTTPPAGAPEGTPGAWTTPPTGAPEGTPGPPTPSGRRPRDPDARRLGRRPRGPAPDTAHTPPGWG